MFAYVVPPKEKKLPPSTLVLNIKQMCKRLFDVEVEHQSLMYILPGSGDLPVSDDDALPHTLPL
jgi:hypothetical protein